MFPFVGCNLLISLGVGRQFGTTSLHDGLARGWRGRWIEVSDAERMEHGSSALRTVCDGSLGGTVAEIDVDDAQRFESGQSVGGGEIDVSCLELVFDGSMQQVGQSGDERKNPILHRATTRMADRSSRLSTRFTRVEAFSYAFCKRT